ncbi:hypothetical protein NS365_04680 [Aureimonas ureilytica]|uniref:Uncharacterized protein n=1 Tax=Aureimonas ureilytica TaxID=401562 RepID=A0A175RWU2_9HYPH|nr:MULTISPECIES: hypothetical protein [Aureimonas]KTR07352.1 hypothetical protein NS365_04680 [Aureimonas ureilytica]
MIPNLHPDHPKAIYREIANDAAPAPRPYVLPPSETSAPMVQDEEQFWTACVGAAFLVVVVLIVYAAKGLA